MKGKILAAIIGAQLGADINNAVRNNYTPVQPVQPVQRTTQSYPAGNYTAPRQYTGYQQHQNVQLRQQPQQVRLSGVSSYTSRILHTMVDRAVNYGSSYAELGEAVYDVCNPLSTAYNHDFRQETRELCRQATGCRHFSSIVTSDYAAIGRYIVAMYNRGEI